MASKLSKRDIARLGVRIPESTMLSGSMHSDTLKSLKKGKVSKSTVGSKTKANFSAHVALQEQRASAESAPPVSALDYPEWIEVRLEDIIAVPKERQRFGKGFVYTSKRTREFERILTDAGAQAMGARPLLVGPVEADLTIFFPIPKGWKPNVRQEAIEGRRVPTRRMDLDNYSCHFI